MAMVIGTEVSFTSNLSGALNFTGMVKIKVDDIPEDGVVEILEEQTDGTYKQAITGGKKLQVEYPNTSDVFYLLGSYKLERSSSDISVGFVE